MATDKRLTQQASPQTDPALSWFRRQFCSRHGHTHGPDGELDCLLNHLALARSGLPLDRPA